MKSLLGSTLTGWPDIAGGKTLRAPAMADASDLRIKKPGQPLITFMLSRGDQFTSVPNSHGENDPEQKKKWENRGVCGAIPKGVQPQQQHQTTDEHHSSSDDLPHTNICEHLHAREAAERRNSQAVEKFLKTFIFRFASCINHYPISRPRVILTAQHGLPRRQNKAGNARLSGLDALPMIECIGTNYLYVDAPHLCGASHRLPLASRQLNRIARIRNHAHAEAKIISGDAICQTIALSFHNNSTQISQSLLHSIDSQISRFNPPGKLLR
jgi:hypothetical protein